MATMVMMVIHFVLLEQASHMGQHLQQAML
jgi:hypothetical protein